MNDSQKANRQRLRELIRRSKKIIAFTGAGISTESGIPDFRSPGGIWSKMEPIQFSDFTSSAAARRESWRRKLEGTGFRGAVPNAGHRALHTLWERGALKGVITQNVDGLHQDSGIPSEQVIELHGNTTYARCLSCARRYEIADMLEVFRRTENGPVCDDCGGYIKTATISFGQSMPEEEMMRAEVVASDCDLFLVLGTSLAVYPAAAFPMMARAQGAKLVILNREPTDQDGLADLVVHDELGDTLTYAVAEDDPPAG